MQPHPNRANRFRQIAVAAILVTTGAASLSACGDDSPTAPVEALGTVSVAGAYSPQPSQGATEAAVYGTVVNTTDKPLTIVSATSSISDSVELVTVVGGNGDPQKTQPADSFSVPAKGKFAMTDTGPQLLLSGVDPSAYPTSFTMTIVFSDKSQVDFTVETTPLNESNPAGTTPSTTAP